MGSGYLIVDALESHERKAIVVITSILDIFRTRKYANLVITCEHNDDNLHRAIACPRRHF